MHENSRSESVLESEQEKKEKKIKLNLRERKVGNFSRFHISICTLIFRGNYKIFFVVEKGKENNIKRSVLLKERKIKKINNFSRRFFVSFIIQRHIKHFPRL